MLMHPAGRLLLVPLPGFRPGWGFIRTHFAPPPRITQRRGFHVHFIIAMYL